jgi:hypothetical protein
MTRDSSIGKATSYYFDSRQGEGIFLYFTVYGVALGLTQPPVPGFLPGGKAAEARIWSVSSI